MRKRGSSPNGGGSCANGPTWYGGKTNVFGQYWLPFHKDRV